MFTLPFYEGVGTRQASVFIPDVVRMHLSHIAWFCSVPAGSRIVVSKKLVNLGVRGEQRLDAYLKMDNMKG